MKLIINAEDFGLSESINKGICEGLKEGFLTSASLFVNAKFTDEAVSLIKENGFKNVGVHLNLTYGKPVCPTKEVLNLVKSDGNFHYMCSMPFYATYDEVKKELKAQIEKFLSFGINPSHLDYHHYFYASKEVMLAFLELAKEYNLPVRSMTDKTREMAQKMGVKTTDMFLADFHESYSGPTVEKLEQIAAFLKDKNICCELMTLPGYVDEFTTSQTNYLGREQELLSLKKAFEQEVFKNLELVDFSKI